MHLLQARTVQDNVPQMAVRVDSCRNERRRSLADDRVCCARARACGGVSVVMNHDRAKTFRRGWLEDASSTTCRASVQPAAKLHQRNYNWQSILACRDKQRQCHDTCYRATLLLPHATDVPVTQAWGKAMSSETTELLVGGEGRHGMLANRKHSAWIALLRARKYVAWCAQT
jgi:hypothetical protein